MKLASLICVLSISTTVAFSQTANTSTSPTEPTSDKASYEKLQQENEYLKKSLNILKPIKSIGNDGLEFKLLKAEGNIKEQTVTFTLSLTNHKANNEFQFKSAQAIDIQGNEFLVKNMFIGKQGLRNMLFTDTPIQAFIEIKQVLPSVKIIKLLSADYYAVGLFPKGSFEFKDIDITWK